MQTFINMIFIVLYIILVNIHITLIIPNIVEEYTTDLSTAITKTVFMAFAFFIYCFGYVNLYKTIKEGE